MKIIDVSSNNGGIDWKKVKADGVTDAIIRLSMGFNTLDKRAFENANAANAAGIAVSYYHFAYPDQKTGGTLPEDAANEARYFTGLFKSGNIPTPKWVAVDLENWERGKDSPLAPADYLEWLQIFLREVMLASGKVPIIYSYGPYLNAKLPTGHGLGIFPLWIAHYTNASTPTLPNGWKSFYLWQKTAKGRIAGIGADCDINLI